MSNSVSNKGHYSFNLADATWKSTYDRKGEKKISQTIKFGIESKSCKFLIIGISEDIGPQMNAGMSGSKNGFKSFCSTFQNIQSNRYLSGEEIGFIGEITQNQPFINIDSCKGWVEELDDFVEEVLGDYTNPDQKLIVIGGGHNNAYPLLKHIKKGNSKSMTSINIDPHADCRKTDYRHSGNPFSFALENKVIDSYTVIGLHESYNNVFILDYLSQKKCDYTTFENFLDNPESLWKKIDSIANLNSIDNDYTLDLDLDAISFSPSSAFTPSGFSIEESRKLIRKLSSSLPFRYIHFPEGSPKTDQEHLIYAKMVCYFVIDFIKCQNNQMK